MKKLTQLLVFLITLGFLFITIIPASAQSSTSKAVLHAEVDRSNITTDDTIILTVTVDMFESGLAKPQLPALEGFQVIGQNNGTQISMLNGEMTVQETFQYYLRPEYTGTIIIEPITLTSQGTVHSTDQIVVNVTKGTGKMNQIPGPSSPSFPNFPSLKGVPSFGIDIPFDAEPMDPALVPESLSGRDYFLEASVDKSSAYQGEQIRYIIRFYKAASPIGDLELKQPSFRGFWHESVPDEKHYSLNFANKNYLVTEVESTLFPTVVGNIEIEPAQITIPGDFFTSGGTLQTNPVTLEIKPLPAGAPDSFNGAIGKFNVKAETDLIETNVNEPIKYRFIVQGEGNVENIPEPEWNDKPAWRSFDTTIETSTQFENGTLVGTKVFERLLVPTQSGEIKIPSLEFSYFDPEEGTYKLIYSDQIQVNVISDRTEKTSASHVGNNTIDQNDMLGIDNSISSIKTTPGNTKFGSKELISNPVFWLLWLVPLFMLTGHIAWVKNDERRQKDSGYRRYKNAAKKAHLALKELKRNPNSSSVERILLEYLSDKLNQPFTGLTLEELEAALRMIEIKEEYLTQIESCILLSEMVVYSPESKIESQIQAINMATSLINILDKEI